MPPASDAHRPFFSHAATKSLTSLARLTTPSRTPRRRLRSASDGAFSSSLLVSSTFFCTASTTDWAEGGPPAAPPALSARMIASLNAPDRPLTLSTVQDLRSDPIFCQPASWPARSPGSRKKPRAERKSKLSAVRKSRVASSICSGGTLDGVEELTSAASLRCNRTIDASSASLESSVESAARSAATFCWETTSPDACFSKWATAS